MILDISFSQNKRNIVIEIKRHVKKALNAVSFVYPAKICHGAKEMRGIWNCMSSIPIFMVDDHTFFLLKQGINTKVPVLGLKKTRLWK